MAMKIQVEQHLRMNEPGATKGAFKNWEYIAPEGVDGIQALYLAGCNFVQGTGLVGSFELVGSDKFGTGVGMCLRFVRHEAPRAATRGYILFTCVGEARWDAERWFVACADTEDKSMELYCNEDEEEPPAFLIRGQAERLAEILSQDHNAMCKRMGTTPTKVFWAVPIPDLPETPKKPD
jgi:hypothetical protein